MASDPTMVMAYGMSAPAALLLVDQVDNFTPNVGLLMGVGFQATQAQALYDGITSSVSDGTPFVSVGFSPNMAAELAALIQGVGAWILATRFWRDTGIWVDTAVWRD